MFFAIQTFGLDIGVYFKLFIKYILLNILLKWYFTSIIISQLLKKPEKGEEPSTEKPKERAEETDPGDGKWEPCPSAVVLKPKPPEGSLEELRERSQYDSDKEQRDKERRSREKELEAQQCHLDDSRKHRAHHELEKCSGRNGEELARGKGSAADGGRRGSQDRGCPVEAAERLGKEKSED